MLNEEKAFNDCSDDPHSLWASCQEPFFVQDLQEGLSPAVPTAPHQAVQTAPVAGVTS